MARKLVGLLGVGGLRLGHGLASLVAPVGHVGQAVDALADRLLTLQDLADDIGGRLGGLRQKVGDCAQCFDTRLLVVQRFGHVASLQIAVRLRGCPSGLLGKGADLFDCLGIERSGGLSRGVGVVWIGRGGGRRLDLGEYGGGPDHVFLRVGQSLGLGQVVRRDDAGDRGQHIVADHVGVEIVGVSRL